MGLRAWELSDFWSRVDEKKERSRLKPTQAAGERTFLREIHIDADFFSVRLESIFSNLHSLFDFQALSGGAYGLVVKPPRNTHRRGGEWGGGGKRRLNRPCEGSFATLVVLPPSDFMAQSRLRILAGFSWTAGAASRGGML